MSDDAIRGVDLLAGTVTHTHDVLAERFATAAACRPTRDLPRARTAAADPFLASTSRHVAAVNAVLGAAVRRLPDGRHRRRDLARHSHDLELALARAKARIYGSTFAATTPWNDVWDEVGRQLRTFRVLEEEIALDLLARRPHEECNRIANRLHHAEEQCPTRPHPYLPHTGLAGGMARSVARRVDRFWDTAEGRMVPPPTHPVRSREGRFTQYLLAEARMGEEGA